MGQAASEVMGNWTVMDERCFQKDKKDWEVIGAGGFGQVFKVKHRQWRKDVAVKIIGLDDGCVKDELVREADLMLRAECPYILKVLGVFKGCTPHSNGVVQVGLVMDLMESGSLHSLQKKRKCQPLPWPLVFRLVHQVAEGMKYLHSLTPALIHKDVKPDNILLDSDLNVKITDFGLAKFAKSVTANAVKGMRTTFYAPPEAFLAPDEAPSDGATCGYDVYSYAVMVWTLLHPVYNDILPFDVSNGVASLEGVRRMNVPGLEQLVELMVKCWNKDPKKRPSFAECTAVTQRLYEMNQSEIQGKVERVKTQRDFQRLTLDTNTTSRWLSMSENNMKVTCDGQDHSYPDHSDRFDGWSQVLCTESLTGRCYWEVEWSGDGVEIAVTYRGIRRKGEGFDCMLGYNDKSWSLKCDDDYSVIHKRELTVLPDRPSISTRVDRFGMPVYSGRVAVYVDHPAGTLSFYAVSSDTLTHLHTFQTTFTEPLYAGFRVVGRTDSVCLCE